MKLFFPLSGAGESGKSTFVKQMKWVWKFVRKFVTVLLYVHVVKVTLCVYHIIMNIWQCII